MLTRCGVLNTTMILNAPQITHKTRYTKTLGRTSTNHEETPRETMTATAMQAMCTNRQPSYKTTESRYTPDHPGQHRTTTDHTGRNQPKAPPRHRRQLDRKAHKPACNISPERKGPPGSRIVPRNSTHLISKSAYRHHQPVRFLFLPDISSFKARHKARYAQTIHIAFQPEL